MASKKDKYLESAQRFMLKGQLDKAIKDYQQVVALEPKEIRYRQKLAELLVRDSRKEEAIEQYEGIGKHYAENSYFLKAIAVYKQIQRLSPGDTAIALELASLNHKQGLIGNALAEYGQVVAQFEKEGDLKEAVKVLEQMLVIDGEHAATRLKYAEILLAAGSADASYHAFNALHASLVRKGDRDSAARIAARIDELFPGREAEAENALSLSTPVTQSGAAVAAELPLSEPPNVLAELQLETDQDPFAPDETAVGDSLSLPAVPRWDSATEPPSAFGEAQPQPAAAEETAVSGHGAFPWEEEIELDLDDDLESEQPVADLDMPLDLSLSLDLEIEAEDEPAPLLQEDSSAPSPFGEVDLPAEVSPFGELTLPADEQEPSSEGASSFDAPSPFGELPSPFGDPPPAAEAEAIPSSVVEGDSSALSPQEPPALDDLSSFSDPFPGGNEAKGGDEDTDIHLTLPDDSDPFPDIDWSEEEEVAAEGSADTAISLDQAGGAAGAPPEEAAAESQLSSAEEFPEIDISGVDEVGEAEVHAEAEEAEAGEVGEAELNAEADEAEADEAEADEAEAEEGEAADTVKSAEEGRKLRGWEEIFPEFTAAGGAEELGELESHYDLGVGYKEMGMYAQAIKELTAAAANPERRLACLTLQAICYREKGEPGKAEELLQRGRELEVLSDEERMTLSYELGNLFESTGSVDQAVSIYRELHRANPALNDVAQRLSALTGEEPLDIIDLDLEEG